MREDTYYLECRTKDKELGMTTLSDKLEDLVKDFSKWLKRNELSPMDVAYAKIVRCSDMACVGTMTQDNGMIYFHPVHVNETVFGKTWRFIKFKIKYFWVSIWWKITGWPEDDLVEFSDSDDE